MGNTNIDLARYYPTPKLFASRQQRAFRELHNCNSSHPCGRLPCKCCGKAMQRWLVRRCKKTFASSSDLQCVSIIIAVTTASDKTLSTIDLKRITRTYRNVIQRAGLSTRLWIGGVDVSRNTYQWDPGKHHWQFQAMLITTPLSKTQWMALRACLVKTDEVLRPLRAKNVYELVGITKYAMKPDFNARYSYVNKEGRRNTFPTSLKGADLRTLTEQMSDSLHQDRLITIGLRRHGNVLVKTQ
ncbi:hypothetical protein [Aestuariivirga sp.]|uniref:hypothetical protein n=1 Tax=Aestuariivirga sp. TaxID=2650926 RepID=UPI0039E41480